MNHLLTKSLIWLIFAVLAACSSAPHSTESSNQGRYSQAYDQPPVNPPDTDHIQQPVPRAEPKSRYGNPTSYSVNNTTYHVLDSAKGYDKTGLASWYGTKFQGHRTSSGEVYDMYQFTAANTELPLPTYVRVTNLNNNKSVIVKVNDRGPFHSGRIIDLSWLAAKRLGILAHGTGRVRVQAIDVGASPSKKNDSDNPTDQVGNSQSIEQPELLGQSPQVNQSNPAGVAHERPTSEATQANNNQPALFLQLGAFKTGLAAERLKQQIKQLDHSLTFAVIQTDGWYKLLTGPFASNEARSSARSLLAANGVETLLRN